MKFHTIDPETHQSIAQIENIEMPEIREFRFNSASKVEELNTKKVLAEVGYQLQSYTTDEIDNQLSKPRKALAI